MTSVAAAILDLLHLPRPRLLIVRAVALPGEITFTCKKIGVPEPLDSIVAAHKRSSRTAYVFFRDAFDNLRSLFSRAKLDFPAAYQCKKLIYYEDYSDVHEAIARESQVKRWSRAKKVTLINRLNPSWLDLGADVLEDR
jgi:hypothetical protein